MQTYGGDGGGGCAHDKKNMMIISAKTATNNRLMMRFRPIAPKPVTGESFPENNKNLLFKGKRSKRKYVRVRTNNTNNRKNRISLDHEKNEKKTAVTLQLLPEKNNQRDSASTSSSQPKSSDLDRTVDENNTNHTSWLQLNNDFFGESLSGIPAISDLTVSKPVEVVESWVTVECITDACMVGGNGLIFSVTTGLGSTDAERLTNLDKDTCPSFVSDGWNKVRWINEAYRKMIRKQEGEGGIVSPESRIIVWLMVKEKVKLMYGDFSCRVRIEYTWQKEKYSKIVPCDVWRMDSGGFAWRLDIKAALSLGL